jgi:maltooligosyltrehalose trehalohydrolase
MTSRLRVWAPRARSVACVVGADRRAAVAEPDGWWSVPAPAPGEDYAFSVDGGPPLPDPRSPRQPHGVHGPSQLVDHRAFRWTDARFRAAPLGAGVIYELHVGTYSPEGTFDGAAGRLDHLVDLGVTHVSLLPVAAFPGRHGWGYDGAAPFAPHEPYGGPDGLRRLVDACHARGLAVLVDVVYNHLGPNGNYLGAYGPYFTDRYRTPWGDALNYDGPGSDEVRRLVCDNARQWLSDYHADGLRLDAVHAIYDASATHILEQLAAEIAELSLALGRPLVLVAESDRNDPRLVRAREAGGFGLDAQWSDDLHHAIHAVATGERDGYYADFGALADVARALTGAFVYDGRFSRYRGRRHGRPATGLSGARFFGYSQTHDQVGNRARGERLVHLVGARRARAVAALVMTAPFVPMIFQGEEWGAATPFQYFTDHTSPELAEAVRRGRRDEHGADGDVPDPQDVATFERSRLDWTEPGRDPHATTLAWYRALVALRRRTPDLVDGRMDRVRVEVDEDARWIRVERGTVTAIVHFGDAPATLARPPGTLALATDPIDAGTTTLPPDSATIWIR